VYIGLHIIISIGIIGSFGIKYHVYVGFMKH